MAANMITRNSTPQDYCREIAYFLSKSPDAWCQGAGARMGDGTPIHPTSPHARQFCMLGLIERFTPDRAMRERVLSLVERAIYPYAGHMPVHSYNDIAAEHVQNVIARFQEAARLSEDGRHERMPDWDKLCKLSGIKLPPWEVMSRQVKREPAFEMA
jgi:hypothetical protein